MSVLIIYKDHQTQYDPKESLYSQLNGAEKIIIDSRWDQTAEFLKTLEEPPFSTKIFTRMTRFIL